MMLLQRRGLLRAAARRLRAALLRAALLRAALLVRVLSGTLDQAAAAHFTASNLVALYKRSEPDAKPRPIACGD